MQDNAQKQDFFNFPESIEKKQKCDYSKLQSVISSVNHQMLLYPKRQKTMQEAAVRHQGAHGGTVI